MRTRNSSSGVGRTEPGLPPAKEGDHSRPGDRGIASDLVAAAGLAAIFLPTALVRWVDGDEGVYAYASRLAVHGHLPYHGFFFEQMPLQPYAYGAWFRIAGESWISARLLSALLAVAVGTLLHRHVRRRSGSVPAAISVAVYASSGLVLGYFTLVKTFALSTLLLFGAYVLLADSQRPFLAGLLLGLTLETRLLLAATVPAFAFAAFRAAKLRGLFTGLALGLTPGLILVAVDPSAFYFDNLRYHALKSSSGLVGDFHQKAQTAATLLGLEPTDRALGVQFLLLLLACLFTLALARARGRATLALAVGASICLVSLFPTPAYVQYFSVAIPFLAVGVGELARMVTHSRSFVVAAGALLVAYLVPAAFAVHGFAEHDPLLKPSLGSVREVAARVEAETSPGERVLSSWPGYLIGTHAWALSDYSNQFAPVAAARLTPGSRREFHVVDERELEARIRRRAVRLVVFRNWVTSPPFAQWDSSLEGGRYRLVAEVATARIFRR